MKFSANLSMLFTEVDFLARFNAAAEAGFKGVEYLFPYDFSIAEIAQKLEDNKLEQVLFNLPAGDWNAGDRGIACDPARVEEFRAGVAKAIEYAKGLDCKRINCLVGVKPEAVSDVEANATLVNNLKYAVSMLSEQNIELVFEPINTFDIPGYFVTNTAQALQIVAEVNHPNLKVQYDIYHMQRMEGNILHTLSENLASFGHIQIADSPARNEPGTGELNYDNIFEALDESSYNGWIGCEYKPKTTTTEGLVWFKPFA